MNPRGYWSSTIRAAAPLRRLIAALCAVVVMVAWPGATHAQVEAVTWQLAPGFDGSFKAGAWFPLTITVSNTGPDLRGTLSVQMRTEQAGIFSLPIDLPHNAKKRIALPILSDPDNSGTVRATVTLRSDGTEVRSERLELNALNSSELVMGVLSEEGNVLPELTNIRGAAQPFGSSLLRLTADTLPDRPELLQTFDVLFVHAIDTAVLSNAQRDALRVWASNGGHLVVGGDPRVVRGLSDILPATATDSGGTSSAQGLSAGTGWQVRSGADPLRVLQLTPKPRAETVLRGDNDLPLLVRQQSGSGSIVLAAFDLAALRDAGDPADFWPRVLRLNRDETSNWLFLRQQGIWMLQQALELPALRLPSVFGFLGFLLVYIVTIGPLNYLVLRRLDRREWAYVTIPLLVLLFSGGAYWWGTQGRGSSAIVSQLSLVRVVGDTPQGQATTYLTLFSPTRYAYDVQLASDALVSDLQQPWQRQGARLEVVYAEDSVQAPDVLVDVGGVRALTAEQVVTVPQVTVTLRNVDGEQRVMLHNRSNQEIADVILARGDGRAQQVGVLEAGVERTIAFKSDRFLQDGFNFTSGGVINRDAIIRHLGNNSFPAGFAGAGRFAENEFIPPPPDSAPGDAPPADPPGALPTATPLAGQPASPPDPVSVLPRATDQFFVLGWQSQALTPVQLDGREVNSSGEALYIWSAQKEQ